MNSVLMPPPTLGDDFEEPETVIVRQSVGVKDPFEKAALKEDLGHALEMIKTYSLYLDNGQREQLREVLKRLNPDVPVDEGAGSPVEYGASFDLASEVEAQIAAVRAVRSTVMSPGGQILPGVSSREAKEVISSGSTLLTTLMKFHEKVVNMDRLRKLESAMLEVLRDKDPQLQEEVLTSLERRLSMEDV